MKVEKTIIGIISLGIIGYLIYIIFKNKNPDDGIIDTIKNVINPSTDEGNGENPDMIPDGKCGDGTGVCYAAGALRGTYIHWFRKHRFEYKTFKDYKANI